MADEVENNNPTDDTPAKDTPTEDTSTEDTPAVEVEEPNYAAQLKDLTDRFNQQADQLAVLVQRVADLENENADLIESVVEDAPTVTDSHDDDKTGNDFLDELFN